MALKKSKKDIIQEVTADLGKVGLDQDDEFIPGGDQRVGFFQRKSDQEMTVDRLLIGCGEGTHLKLKKEVSPNEFQYKEKIPYGVFKSWVDLEIEVNEMVRAKTAQEIQTTGKPPFSWGSARYQIEVVNERGNREEGRAPIFYVDAKEYEVKIPANPTGIGAGGMSGMDMAEILRTAQAGTVSPGDLLKEQAAAMRLGAEMAGKKEDAATAGNNQLFTMMMNQQNQSTTLMATMMTSMMTAIAAISGKPAPEMPKQSDPMDVMRGTLSMIKDMGIFKQDAPPKEKDMLETFQIWKAAGLLPDATKKEEDPFAQISKMKQIMGFMQELTGAGPAERPGIVEQLVVAAGPKLADVLMMGMQWAMQKDAAANPQPTPIQPPTVVPSNTTPNQTPPAEPVQVPTEGEEANMLKFAMELKEYVKTNNTSKYPYINEVLMKSYGDEIMTGIKMDMMGADDIVRMIKMKDMLSYSSSEMTQKLKQYAEGFVRYVKSVGFDTVCSKCGLLSIYENKNGYDTDATKSCDRESSPGVVCGGALSPQTLTAA